MFGPGKEVARKSSAGIEKRTAEGDAAKAEALTKRLAEHLANSAQKCETYSRQMADNDAKIAAADAKIAELRKINEGFQKFNAELPQMTRDLEAVLAGKITGGQRDAVIRKLEAFVGNGHALIKQTRAVPSLQTPENIALLASFEKAFQTSNRHFAAQAGNRQPPGANCPPGGLHQAQAPHLQSTGLPASSCRGLQVVGRVV